MDPNYAALVYLAVVIMANMLLTLYVGARLFHAISKVRSQSKRADETSRRLQQKWEQFNNKQTEMIREKLAEIDKRAGNFEKDTANRIQNFESQIGTTRHELQRLEQYLREVFEVEMKNVFDSFDSTVGGVLDQMKSELMRGVDRIEQIQSVMESRNACEGRLADSRETIRRLSTGEASAEGETESGPSAGSGESDEDASHEEE